MDLAISMVVMTVIGIWRLTATDGLKKQSRPVMHEDGTVEYPADSIPVGNNLELMYEVDAYTLILKQLGLY